MATVYRQHLRTLCASARGVGVGGWVVLGMGGGGGRISHLTRRGVGVLLGVNLVVLGDFDPLVGFHAGLTQPLPTLHAKAYGPGIVFTTCAYLKPITRVFRGDNL